MGETAAVALTAGMVFLSVVGGFPESAFLIVCFAGLYFLFRLLVTPEFRERPFGRLGKLAAGIALGFALSGFLLLPFLEYMRIAHDVHQLSNVGGDRSGLAFDTDFRSLLLYLLPLSFGLFSYSADRFEECCLFGVKGRRQYFYFSLILLSGVGMLCSGFLTLIAPRFA